MRSPLILLGLLLAAVLACTPTAERAERARAEAREALARGERSEALKLLRAYREVHVETPEGALEAARLLTAAGEAAEASWLLESALPRHPERDDLRLALAQLALLLGNPSQARTLLAPIGPDSEQHAQVLLARARAELALGDLERGLALLAEAEERDPDRPETRLARVATLLQEHRLPEARAAAEEAREALAGDREARRRLELTLAQIHLFQGDVEAAIEALRALIRSEPTDLAAWHDLVQTLVRSGRAEEALASIEQALAEHPEAAGLHWVAASVHASQGRDADAEAALRRFVELSESPAAYAPLVDFYSGRGDLEQAHAVLEEAVERFPGEATLHVFQAETLIALGRLDEARVEVDRFRSLSHPEDPNVEYLRARLELARGEASAAAARLRRLVPRLDRPATQFWLGVALEHEGDLEGARRRYALAEARDPSWPPPRDALIRLAQRRGDWRDVVGTARRGLRSQPGLVGLHMVLVDALVNLGEGAAAEAHARSLLEQHPEREEPPVLLARALRSQGRTDEALAELEAAGSRLGERPGLVVERALTLGVGGRVREGIEVARAGLARDPEAAELHRVHAALLFELGAAEEGARAVDRALELDPDDPSPLRLRCEFRAATRRYAGARSDCQRYLASRPDDPHAQFVLGVVEASLGDPGAAMAAYRRAAALDEHDFRPRNNLAELLAEQGDLDAALEQAQEAYRLAPDDPFVLDTLGALYLRKGLVERAIALLERSHALASDLPQHQLDLALAYREAGRAEEARELLVALRDADGEDAGLRGEVERALASLP